MDAKTTTGRDAFQTEKMRYPRPQKEFEQHPAKHLNPLRNKHIEHDL